MSTERVPASSVKVGDVLRGRCQRREYGQRSGPWFFGGTVDQRLVTDVEVVGATRYANHATGALVLLQVVSTAGIEAEGWFGLSETVQRVRGATV